MNIDLKKLERIARAKRLVKARKDAGFSGATDVANRLGINVNNYKAHEAGRNGFETIDGKKYAKAFKVNVNWLMLGEGEPDDLSENKGVTKQVPLISWISAGELKDQEQVSDLSDYPVIETVDLSEGEWIALRVDGNSMNKISPPDSIIFVNTRDKRLIANGCYVIADETGKATYKRYRPNETPQFQPASYDDVPAPDLKGVIHIIGRVRRSVIDM